MAISPNGGFGEYQYTSTNGTVYRKKVSFGVATAAGWTLAAISLPDWGNRRGANKVAGVYGVDATLRHRAFLPCPSMAAAEGYFVAGTFLLGGTTYNVTGIRGEQRSLK